MKKTIATAPNEPSKHVDLTAEEVTARQAEEAQALLDAPIKQAELEEAQAIQKIIYNDAKSKYSKMTKAEKDALKGE